MLRVWICSPRFRNWKSKNNRMPSRITDWSEKLNGGISLYLSIFRRAFIFCFRIRRTLSSLRSGTIVIIIGIRWWAGCGEVVLGLVAQAEVPTAWVAVPAARASSQRVSIARVSLRSRICNNHRLREPLSRLKDRAPCKCVRLNRISKLVTKRAVPRVRMSQFHKD